MLGRSNSMTRKRLHHVGIVLPTMDAVDHVMTMFGFEKDYQGFVEAYQADLIFTKYGEHESPIEFIVPHEGSVLKEFNGGKGGIAHIALEVDDVEAVRREFEAKGLHLLEQKAVKGTDDIIINFLRPRYSEHILVEFIQTVAPIRRNV
jgi:lactoylglutathione lyase/methylmalonyl-CoA/ethylmalonyl-CoA epimerase